jgi:hypothetical protein
MEEDKHLKEIKSYLEKNLHSDYIVKKGANLFYELYLNRNLDIDVKDLKNPKRGFSAFQTDLCIFKKQKNGIELPKVAIEFKTKITTHDILMYSDKVIRTKEIYPQLRYGLYSSNEDKITTKFFTHNLGFDFYFTTNNIDGNTKKYFLDKINDELKYSDRLEKMYFENGRKYKFYRTIPELE